MSVVIPESSPLFCQGCGAVYPPNPESTMMCDKCHAPLVRITPEAAYSMQTDQEELGPEQGYFGPSEVNLRARP